MSSSVKQVPNDPKSRANRRVAYATAGATVLMLGLSFAAVPLYAMFCAATGFGGTPRIVQGPAAGLGERTLTVRFDANVGGGLDWSFEPEVGQMRVRTGETTTVFYKVVNRSSRPMTGIATYNVAPDQVGFFFAKISCFCFTEQTLQPGESMDMPVVFFLDPALEKDETMKKVQSLTRSYTFMPARSKTPSVTAVNEPGKAAL